ncbi:MAG: phosphohydrolase [Betaproteobacteria bacterium RBG_16_58_11]|nr:MAG: phosphohydrolase [Betaproteobacteria bacterium RBG_16_58_11]OFZ96164.1 MAG: phosphohydrolase [Betaproteobacteria bacterium RBG_19FT_COMBO_58_11]
MPVSLEEFTQDIDSLVSLPGVGVRVNEMVDDPSSTAADLGKVISQDPALAARLLRIANSPAYGLSSQVNTVTRAVSIIGTRHIRDLVLATSTISAFEGIPNELVSMEDFWSHSLYCGAAARLLAEQCNMKHAETVFLGGLLHDIGQLVIFRKEPQKAKQALLLSIEEHDDLALHKAEQEIFGFDHAGVGAALLRHWHFPELLIESVAFHHAPEQAQHFPLETALVHIANSIATLAEIDSVSEADAVQTEAAAWRVTGLDKSTIEPTVRATQAQFAEMRNLLLG